jgi:hypothetical protein
VGLATYYTEKGETPGVWMGAGMGGIEGLEAGDQVTADHMQSLFGSGHHPLTGERIKELDLRIGRPGEKAPTAADYQAATRLGTPYRVYKNDVTPFQREVATRFEAVNEAAGLPGDWPIPAEDRARIRTEIAGEFFTAEHGREATDARELAATIAKNSRPKTTAVAGYDLTFSPVKSFSVMWALADPATAARLEQAHNQAVADTLEFIEDYALFTREGTNGVRQVDTKGLIATAFTHRVHPPRLPRRRPGSAHPRRDREQGPDPPGQVARDRRSAAAQDGGRGLGALQRPPGGARPRHGRRPLR